MGNRNSVLKGTALLTGAGLIVKILGAAYRIPLSRLIGAEGIGLYQMAYPVYLIFLSLSTAGIPIAISKVIAEQAAKGNQTGIDHTFKASLILLSFLGVFSSLGMALSVQWLAKNVVADPRAVYAMWALTPAIFLMSMMAAFRGFFQGWREMGPSACSQVVEQVVRVSVALILAVLLLKSGVEHASAGAAFGATAGGAAGLLYLMFVFWRDHRLFQKGNHPLNREILVRTIRKLVRFAFPISIAAILMPLLQTLDTVVVPTRLQGIGYTVSQSTSMLGVLGNSWAILYLPTILTAAIASNLVPAIAAVKAARRGTMIEAQIREGLRLATIYLIPVMVLLNIFGRTVYRIVYGTGGIEILSWFAPAVLFLGLQQVSAAMLQGLGKPNWPLFSFGIGALVKVVVTVITTGWPGLNLAGAALGTVCGSGVTAGLNLLAIKRLTTFQFPLKAAVFFSGLIMFGVGKYLTYSLHLHFLLEALLVGVVSFLLYLGTLWILGGINSRDLELVKIFLRKRRFRNG
jgi:stage V sporulation protein B